MVIFSNVFRKNKNALVDKKRFIINQGGSSSTKTFSILQILVILIQNHKVQIDVVGLNVPHLKSGVLKDMPAVCEGLGVDFYSNFAVADRILTLKGQMNFLAFDKLGKAHGGRRDYLFLNEANHQSLNIVEQLMLRTRKVIFIDYNPTNKFWVHSNILEEQKDKSILIKSTYKDNPCLEQEIIDFIESKRGDNNFWRVYGEGEIGLAEGLVFNNFEQKLFDKEQFSVYRHGLDWGFSKDPLAYIRLAINRDELYICDEIYQTGLTNRQSSDIIKPKIKEDWLWCDSAEPKSIAEYQQYGINARPVKKGQGSVITGIKFLQSFKKIYIHTDCHKTYDEFCCYDWIKDKNGEQTTEPTQINNHAIDAIRYALERDFPFQEKQVNIDKIKNFGANNWLS